ncbi:hypothetical protein LguiB_005547 [Lonicera macranthoides]
MVQISHPIHPANNPVCPNEEERGGALFDHYRKSGASHELNTCSRVNNIENCGARALELF